MKLQYLVIMTLSAVFLAGCGGDAANTGNTSNAVANNTATASKPTRDEVTNDAPTLTPLVKSYCEAKIKKDEAGLRKAFSQETIKSFEEQMKEDNIKTLVEFLQDEKVSDKLCQVKNERISGDTAVAKVYTDGYPNGLDFYFEKENGEWKMTNKSPSFEAAKQANSNTAK